MECNLKNNISLVFKLGMMNNWFHGESTFISMKDNCSDSLYFGIRQKNLENELKIVKLNNIDFQNTDEIYNMPIFFLHMIIHSDDNRCIILINEKSVVEVSKSTMGLLPLSQESLMLTSIESYKLNFSEYYNEYVQILKKKDEELLYKFLIKNKIYIKKALSSSFILFLKDFGCFVSGRSIQEAWFHGVYLVYACQTQLKLGNSICSQNIVYPAEEAINSVKEFAFKEINNVIMNSTDEAIWSKGTMEFEAVMRAMEDLEFTTNYAFKMKNILRKSIS